MAQLDTVLQHIRNLVSAKNGDTPSDLELLDRFRTRKDPSAFAVLLKRHGPMVLAVCRHVLQHHQDAEDAFQATFLILARQASTIRKQHALASWLHGVAYRIAMNAKRSAARRRKHEGRTGVPPVSVTGGRPVPPTSPDPAWELSWREVQAVLDEEIERLPSKYRVVFVLCCLEGIGRAEAGRQLGLKEGTVSSRLHEARHRLQQRLARRGVTLSSVLAAAALAQKTATAAVPPFLVNGTIQAAQLLAAGEAGAAGAISANVIGLVEKAGRAMLMTKLRIATVLLLAAGALASGVGLAAHQVLAVKATEDNPQAAKPAQSAQPIRIADKSMLTRTDRYGDPLPEGAVARLGTLRLYHGHNVDRVILSHDAKLVVSTTHDGNRLWDAVTGRELPLRDGLKHALIFTWKDQLLAAEDGGKFWDLATGKEAANPHVTLNAAGVPIAKGQPFGNWVEEQNIVSPNGTIRAIADGKRILLRDARTGKELLPLDKQRPSFEGRSDQPVLSLTFSPDSKLLASTHPGPVVRLWDLATRKELRQFRGKDSQVFRTVFSADGKTLAGADGSSVTLWDVATGKWRHDFGHTYYVSSLAFAPDGKTLLTGSGYNDSVIRLWDPLTGREKAQWGKHTLGIQALTISPDGKLVASGSQDGTLRLWDLATTKEVRHLGDDKHTPWSAAFSPDGKMLASGDERVRLWNVETGRELRSFGGGTILHLAFSPDGKTLASIGSREQIVRLWNVASGAEMRQLGGQSLVTYSCLAFSPDGKVLANGQSRGPIHFWDPATGKEVRLLGEVTKPDNRSSYVLGSITFSPDGRTLAAGYTDETVRLWEVAATQERARFHGHRAGVTSLAFSPDGTLLASGSWDRTVLIWDVKGQKATTRQRRAVLEAEDLNSLWADLASADARKAYRAMGVLLAASQQAVPFFKEQLRPAAAGNQKRIAQLLADLDSNSFAAREIASQALLELGDAAEPALRTVLARKPSAESRRRAEAILAQLDPAKSPMRLRLLRAVEVLEHIGTPEARQVLESLAKGAPEARLTHEAKASMDRLQKRAGN